MTRSTRHSPFSGEVHSRIVRRLHISNQPDGHLQEEAITDSKEEGCRKILRGPPDEVDFRGEG